MQDLRRLPHYPFQGLSKQETLVAAHITRGLTEKEIAEKLFISPKTVNNHSYNIKKKWGARNAVDIARKFILSLDDPKKFFIAVGLLIIQSGIVYMNCDMDMRRSRVTAKEVKVRVVTSRRNLI